MLRKLYDWVFSLARHRHATWALAGVSFAESSIFPIPPDTLLIPMVLFERRKWIFYACICLIASILGAYLGYFFGSVLYESIGKPVLEFYGKQDAFEKITDWNDRWGGWGILLAAVTPFPYKVITIFSGFTHISLIQFTIVSVFGRGLRFFLVAGLIYVFGEPIREFIEKRLGLMFMIAMVLLIGGFIAVKFLF
ncbi:MAG: DedA family protein [Hyphomicrobiales bacterium]|nr:DedA family protein [Hyphomicrobiales bacterium]